MFSLKKINSVAFITKESEYIISATEDKTNIFKFINNQNSISPLDVRFFTTVLDIMVGLIVTASVLRECVQHVCILIHVYTNLRIDSAKNQW